MFKKFAIAAIVSAFLLVGNSVAQSTGKNPVIIIPGVLGSKLVDPKADKTLWFSVKQDKDEDLRLPMLSPLLSRNRDRLLAVDIIRSVEILPILPDIEVYQSVIDALKERGYTEAEWDKPQASDVFYVFPYDWRRDNVETAHLLLRRMTGVKRTLGKPGLKFDIIAHSMGGLIARYAAMYGLSQPSARRPVPNWSGAAHIDKLMMFGTPNEGSFGAFDVLLNGYAVIGKRKLPLVDDLDAEDVMSAPSVYQLLPHNPSARFLDRDLKPINVDIYDVNTWIKYGWGAIADPKFLGKLRDAPRLAKTNKEIKPDPPKDDAGQEERLVAQLTFNRLKAFMSSALERAQRFHLALNAPVKNSPIRLYAYGGNCEPTLDAVVLVQDRDKGRWSTLIEAKDIKSSSGNEIKKDAVEKVMFALGDGRVTVGSLFAENGITENSSPRLNKLSLKSTFLGCGSHNKLFLEKPIKDSFLAALVVEEEQQP